MVTETRNPPPGLGDGLGNRSMLGSENDPENSQSGPKTQGLISELKRDFAIEAFRIAAIKIAHVGDDLVIGDDCAATRNLRVAIDHVKEGARVFREMQALLAGPKETSP